MERKFVYLFFILLSFSSLNALNYTGQVSAQPTNVTVFVINVSLPKPIINITHPENKTYIINKSLFLNFTSYYEEDIWYNIDNGQNISLKNKNSDIFDVLQGSHLLNLYATNQKGESFDNVSFFVNSSILRILYGNYAGQYKGNSTDFNQTAYENLLSLQGIVLENTLWGKILFNKAINVEDDLNSSDKFVDIDSNTAISFNRVEVNSTALPNFNKSAKISLYNIPFTNPRILRNGEICPSSICAFESFVGGTEVFNVSNLGIYSLEESPTITPISEGYPGAGGVALVGDFELDKFAINAFMRQGETFESDISIINKENILKDIEISVDDSIKGFVNIPNKIKLNPKGSKNISFLVTTKSYFEPGLYFGKIYFKNKISGVVKEVSLYIEIESGSSLLDVKAILLKNDSSLLPGDTLPVDILLFNLADKKLSVKLNYQILDLNNNVVFSYNETINLLCHDDKLRRDFLLSKKLPSGRYLFYVKARYDNKIASSSFTFYLKRWYSIKLLIEVILFLVIFCWIFFAWKKKKKKQKGKNYQKKASYKKSRFSNQKVK